MSEGRFTKRTQDQEVVMAKTTESTMTTQDVPDATRALAKATAEHTAATLEVARLRGLIRGSIERWEQRTERRTVLSAEGRPTSVDVTVPTRVMETVDPVARLQAQRSVLAAEDRLLECEVNLEQARRDAAVAERAARERVIAEGVALVRGEWPRLAREQQRLQREWQAFQGKLEALDARLGQAPRFAEVAFGYAMAKGGLLDTFIAAIRETYGIE
jgi:hypothetical protein